MSAYTDDGKSHAWCLMRIILSALKPASAAQQVRQATLVLPRRAKVEFGPYRQKKTLEASASRVVVEHRGVEPLTSTMRMSRATNCANAPWFIPR